MNLSLSLGNVKKLLLSFILCLSMLMVCLPESKASAAYDSSRVKMYSNQSVVSTRAMYFTSYTKGWVSLGNYSPTVVWKLYKNGVQYDQGTVYAGQVKFFSYSNIPDGKYALYLYCSRGTGCYGEGLLEGN